MMRWTLILTLVSSQALSAQEPATASAKEHYERGLSAFGLRHFDEAAKEYEAAFSLKPDPALLYDAAQAHRASGNKARALELYEAFVTVFEGETHRETAQRHILNLKEAIAQEEAAKKEATQKEGAKRAASVAAPNPTLFAQPVPAQQRPARSPRRRWIWGVVGGAAVAVVAIGVGLGVGLGMRDRDPTASFGSVQAMVTR
jgi:hypothetical protein